MCLIRKFTMSSTVKNTKKGTPPEGENSFRVGISSQTHTSKTLHKVSLDVLSSLHDVLNNEQHARTSQIH